MHVAASFQSTPLMRGETAMKCDAWRTRCISIHSPHARGDCAPPWCPLRETISIHSPHARGDKRCGAYARDRNDFNPLPSCEGRQMCGLKSQICLSISIHSPHARGDEINTICIALSVYFNPLPSCEGRQHKPPKILLNSRQSIQQKHHSSFF